MSRKVQGQLEKQQKRRVIDFADLQLNAERAKELERGVISEEGMRELDPLHAVYAYAQNKLSVIVEQLMEMPACARLAKAYASAEEEYMPSGPPMSPLTSSYFFSWAVFDLCVGRARETLGTVAIDVCRRLGTESSLLRLFEHMQESRTGFYMHEGTAGTHVLLREFVTNKQCECVVPAGYMGKTGEIWLVRVMPEPFETLHMGYSLVFNTPYVICKKTDGQFFPADPAEWQSFFDRTTRRTGKTDATEAYAHLMKYGLSENYWNEYVFEAYVNHRPDMIMLAGFPDIALSMPHSRESEAARGESESPRQGTGKPASIPALSRKTGRNEPCPCGSGKKYKKCCGAG